MAQEYQNYKYGDKLGFSKPFGYNPVSTDKVIDKYVRDKDDLQNKLASLVGINTQLENEKEELAKQLEDSKNEIRNLERKLIDFQIQVQNLKIDRPTTEERDSVLDEFHKKDINKSKKTVKLTK